MPAGLERTLDARMTDDERLSFTVRLGSTYAALFLVYGLHLPYLPVWLHWRGLSAEEIAVITATPLFVRVLVTPTVAFAADRFGAHSRIIVALAWGSLALAILLNWMQNFWPILIVAVPYAMAISTIMPLTETIAIGGVRTAGLDYGRMRLWGSLGFVAVGIAGGALVAHYGPVAVVWSLVAATSVLVLGSLYLPSRMPASALDVVAATGSVAPRLSGREALKLIRSPLFVTFLLAAGAVHGSHGLFYTFGVLHWQSQGIPTAWTGLLWATAIPGEVLLFAYSGAVVRRFGAIPLLVAGSAAAVMRWSAMSFDPPLALLFPIQMLHGMTYGAAHLGAMHFLSRAVPERAAGTAQAFYATVATGLVIGCVTLASGHLYALAAGRAYLAVAALASVGFVASLVLLKKWNGDSLFPDGFSVERR